MNTAAASHAVRHPHAEIASPKPMGARARSPAEKVEKSPSAVPRSSSKRSDTVTVLTSESEPWPSSRMPMNPIAKVTRPVTNDMFTNAAANTTPMTACERRTPCRSMKRPTDGKNNEAISVPTR